MLNILVQIANKMGFQKKNEHIYSRYSGYAKFLHLRNIRWLSTDYSTLDL
jgi:hypothetical protein